MPVTGETRTVERLYGVFVSIERGHHAAQKDLWRSNAPGKL
jgi:hypothetical protein